MPGNEVDCDRTARTLSMALVGLSYTLRRSTLDMSQPFRTCAHLGFTFNALLAAQCWLVPLLLLSRWLVDPVSAAIRACRRVVVGIIHDANTCTPVPRARAM
jgi:hypothetical protein